jgi:hypothetical protein
MWTATNIQPPENKAFWQHKPNTFTPDQISEMLISKSVLKRRKQHHQQQSKSRIISTLPLARSDTFMLNMVTPTGLSHVLSHPAVYAPMTTSTNMAQVLNTFGDEAKSHMVLTCGERIMSGGGEINVQPRVMNLLTDIIMYEGEGLNIDRHALEEKTSTESSTQFSFEKCGYYVAKSTVKGEYDSLSQLPSAGMLGRIPDGILGSSVSQVIPTTDNDDILTKTSTTTNDADDLMDLYVDTMLTKI